MFIWEIHIFFWLESFNFTKLFSSVVFLPPLNRTSFFSLTSNRAPLKSKAKAKQSKSKAKQKQNKAKQSNAKQRQSKTKRKRKQNDGERVSE